MYKDILFPVDISHPNEWKHALSVCIEYAEAFGSTLHIMTVLSDAGMSIVSQYFAKDSAGKLVAEVKESLHNFVKDNVPSDIKVQHIVSTGSVYECIIQTAKQIDVDLIIMSAHRPELKDYLLGPNSARVVRHSDKSVLVVRQ